MAEGAAFATFLRMIQSKIPFTQEGYDRLVAELEHLHKVDRPACLEDLQEARAQGDLSENAEYDAAKSRLSQIDARMGELQDKIRRAEIIKVSAAGSSTVVFGSTVTVTDPVRKKDTTYTLVGPEDVDLMQNRISISSPIGKALMGCKKGDTVEVTTPRGLKKLVIKELC